MELDQVKVYKAAPPPMHIGFNTE